MPCLLCGAGLGRAGLGRAGLGRAGLCRADLSRADLSRADLCRAGLCRAGPCRADLCCAVRPRDYLYSRQLKGNKSRYNLFTLPYVVCLLCTSNFRGCKRGKKGGGGSFRREFNVL